MNLFRTPKAPETPAALTAPPPAPIAPPTPEAPPAVPTIDTAANNVDARERLRKRRGAASTMLVPTAGAFSAPPTSAAQLLG